MPKRVLDFVNSPCDVVMLDALHREDSVNELRNALPYAGTINGKISAYRYTLTHSLEMVVDEMQSLGIKPNNVSEMSLNRIISIETGDLPFEALTEREKQCFDLLEKWFALNYSKVRLERDFCDEGDKE